MVRVRGGSTSAGRSFRLRDEDIEVVEPPPVAPKKKIVTRGDKVKQTAQRKLVTPTAESSDEQMEGQNSEWNIAGGNEEPEQVTQGDETVTRSSAKRKRTAKRKSIPHSKKKQSADPSDDQQNVGNTTGSQQIPEPSTRKSPRTRTEAQNVGASATQTSNRKRSGKNPVSQPFLLKISTDSRRKLSYGRFLTPIFAHFEIPFSGKSPKDSASSVFSKAYFERKNLTFFEGHWCYKETVAESRRKNFHETPVTPRTPRDQSDFVSPFTIHPRKSASRSFASNSEVISLLEDLKQHVLLIEEGPTTGAETTLASSSQPKDKSKAPTTEESDEDSDEETEEEEDPAQYRLARRRPGSSKITI
ncbi:nucleolar and coiled-body phosphoprotein 1-like [Coffea eugenioides]|uniref:nucleolar and coiled-body phosphoprotein 1-like n=1 Tax=Coffea eugenioides TaxID=49369 RepID=UPI000F613994|nr:nucleolar and coiled-body phosphoprotein 1-like [Coffea eugenioides]